MKHHYLKKGFLQSLKYGRYYWCRFACAERVWKDFETKDLGEYHDLYLGFIGEL